MLTRVDSFGGAHVGLRVAGAGDGRWSRQGFVEPRQAAFHAVLRKRPHALRLVQ